MLILIYPAHRDSTGMWINLAKHIFMRQMMYQSNLTITRQTVTPNKNDYHIFEAFYILFSPPTIFVEYQHKHISLYDGIW